MKERREKRKCQKKTEEKGKEPHSLELPGAGGLGSGRFSQSPLSTAPASCLGLFLWALPPSTPLAHQGSSGGSVQQWPRPTSVSLGPWPAWELKPASILGGPGLLLSPKVAWRVPSQLQKSPLHPRFSRGGLHSKGNTRTRQQPSHS